jgi:hypothetical protein
MTIAPRLQSGDCRFAAEQSPSCNLVAPGIFAIARPWKKILLKEEPLEPAHAQTLYFIVGFVASAVKKEGICRQKNGFLTRFA